MSGTIGTNYRKTLPFYFSLLKLRRSAYSNVVGKITKKFKMFFCEFAGLSLGQWRLGGWNDLLRWVRMFSNNKRQLKNRMEVIMDKSSAIYPPAYPILLLISIFLAQISILTNKFTSLSFLFGILFAGRWSLLGVCSGGGFSFVEDIWV